MTHRNDLYKQVSTPCPCGNGTIEYRWFTSEDKLVFLYRGKLSPWIQALLETSSEEQLSGLISVRVRKLWFRNRSVVYVTTRGHMSTYVRLEFARRFQKLCRTFQEPRLVVPSPRESRADTYGFEPA